MKYSVRYKSIDSEYKTVVVEATSRDQASLILRQKRDTILKILSVTEKI